MTDIDIYCKNCGTFRLVLKLTKGMDVDTYTLQCGHVMERGCESEHWANPVEQ